MVNPLFLTKDTLAHLSPEQALEGLVLLVDKPTTWTSFDVVNKVRYALRKRLAVKKLKVGHAGTLDPMATGLLILCTGKYTTLLDSFQAKEKTYSGTITLGGQTASYDTETPVEHIQPWEHLKPEDVENALQPFRGPIQQVPPIFSAIKVDGKRAYLMARKGREITMEARAVTIHSFEIDTSGMPDIAFNVVCSKGTYIRSLAHDLGQQLGCGGYLSSLRREAIGESTVEKALTLQEISSWCD